MLAAVSTTPSRTTEGTVHPTGDDASTSVANCATRPATTRPTASGVAGWGVS